MAQLEISVVGTFDFKPPLSISAETALLVKQAAAMKQGVLNTDLWAPGTKDFLAVAPGAAKCDSFLQVLGNILKQPEESIGRLNIFTHGEGWRISFNGHMVASPVKVDVFFDDYNTGSSLGILNQEALDELNTPGKWVQIVGNPKQFTLADIRKRFVKTNPLVIIYACKSGTDPKLIQNLADTLDVMVDGFKARIAYCPKFAIPPSAPNIERNRVGVSDCATFVTTSYYELLPFAANRHLDITKKPAGSKRTAIPA